MKETIRMIAQKFIPLFLVGFLQQKFIYQPRIKGLGLDNNKVSLFNSVFFEVRTRCNGTCPFCAASVRNDTRKDSEMPFELHKKVVDELKELNYSGRIAYHVNNDPLIFPHLVEFVDYARKNLPRAWIQILTNGKALTENKAEELIRAGINELSINVYNDNFSAPLPKVICNVRDEILPKYFKPERIKSGFGPGKEDNLFRFNIVRRRATEILSSRAGTAPNKKEKTKMPRGFCEYPFTQFNITTDGRVSKCCADLYFSDVMGNVNNEKIMDIWQGENFQRTRQFLLHGRREAMNTCRKCDFYGVKKAPSFFSKIIYFLTQ